MTNARIPASVALILASISLSACSTSNASGTNGNPDASTNGGTGSGTGGSGQGTGGSGKGTGGGSTTDGGPGGTSGGDPWDGAVVVGDGGIGTKDGPPAGATIMTVDPKVVRTLPSTFHGYNYVAYWDGNQGSPGSAAGLKRIGIEITRFPGGVPGMYYRWDDQFPNKDTSTSLNDLWTYVQKIRPDEAIMFETNPTTNNGNDPSGTHITALMNKLKTDGIKIKYFEIGNEPEMPAPNGMSESAYFAAFNDQAKAIHAACADCIVMGPSVFTFMNQGNTWIPDFVAACGANADAISVHSYGPDNTVPGGNPSPGGWWGPVDKQSSKVWFDRYNLLRTWTTKPIYITEWTTNSNPGSYHLGGKVAGAIADADVIGAMAKTTGTDGYTLFGTVHTIWTSFGLFGDQGYGEQVVYKYKAASSDSNNLGEYLDMNAAMAPMLHMWSSVMGRNVLDLSHTADIATVNGWAASRSDGSIQVMLINKQETAAAVRVVFKGFDPTGHKVNIHELKGLNGKAWDCGTGDPDCTHYFYNGVAEAQLGDRTKKDATSVPGSVPPPTQVSCTGPNIDRSLPALSLTILDFLP